MGYSKRQLLKKKIRLTHFFKNIRIASSEVVLKYIKVCIYKLIYLCFN